MSLSSVRLLSAATVVIGLSAAAVARADYTNWSYTWDIKPTVLSANAGGVGVVTFDPPTLPQGVGQGTSPVAPIVLVAGTTALGTAQSPADQFQNAAYTADLTITDNADPSQSHDFSFQGLLSGSESTGLVHFTNAFVNGVDQLSAAISGRQYTVTLGLTGADATAADYDGALNAAVQVGNVPVIDPPPSTKAPEPASLLLAGLALPAAGLTAWRRLRRKAVAQTAAG